MTLSLIYWGSTITLNTFLHLPITTCMNWSIFKLIYFMLWLLKIGYAFNWLLSKAIFCACAQDLPISFQPLHQGLCAHQFSPLNLLWLESSVFYLSSPRDQTSIFPILLSLISVVSLHLVQPLCSTGHCKLIRSFKALQFSDTLLILIFLFLQTFSVSISGF